MALPMKSKLLDAILAQKRQADAVPLSRELKRDSDTAGTLIKSRLKAIMAQPGWKSDMLKRLEDGTYSLDLRGFKVTDLTMLEGLPVSRLDITGLKDLDLRELQKVPALRSLAVRERGGDLSALRGMKLTSLDLWAGGIPDLSPLAGMPLEQLNITYCQRITDLSPLRGAPLQRIEAVNTGVSDLSPLRDSPVEYLILSGCPLKNLDGLQKLPLKTLNIMGCPIEDLAPLHGSSVKNLVMDNCGRIRDVSPLAGCKQLEVLTLPSHLSDIAFLKTHPALKRLNNQPVAEFFAKNGERLARQVPQEKQLEKFRQSLIAQGNDPEKVPVYSFGSGGKLTVKVQTPAVWNVTDISGLRGVAVTSFICDRPIRDITPLSGAPLESLTLTSPSISDLSPLRDAKLSDVFLCGTSVSDLSPLRGMPVRKLCINGTAIADVAMLAGFTALEEVILPSGAKNVEALRRLPQLQRISYKGTGPGAAIPTLTAAEFWKEFDAKKAGSEK